MAGHDRQLVNGGTSPYHSLTCKKAKRRRKLVTWPVFVNYRRKNKNRSHLGTELKADLRSQRRLVKS